jgi:ribose/xylose/arabinose/galactoside ABC-type transport system permease subunit
MTVSHLTAPLRQLTVWLLLALVTGISLAGSGFWTDSNLQNLVVAVSIEGVMVVGMTIAMIGGGFDLSVGSVVALSGVIAVKALPLGMPVAISCALVAAGGIGLANGLLITRLAVNPFIATLGTMVMVRGLVMTFTDAQPVSGSDLGFMSIGRQLVLGVPMPGWIFALSLVGGHILLRYHRIGRAIYALGGNEQAARSSGIATSRLKIGSYVLCSVSAGVSGVLLASRLNTGSPIIGESTALDVITAVLLGGTSLTGGIGSVPGSFAGLLCIGVLGNGLNLFDVPAYYQRIAQGLLLILIVILDRVTHRRSASFIPAIASVLRLRPSN